MPLATRPGKRSKMNFSFNAGAYTSTGKNEHAIHGLYMLLCPSCHVERSALGTRTDFPPQNSERVPPNASGTDPYTTHYVGIMGPLGTNPATEQDYASEKPSIYGGFAMQGVLYRESAVSIGRVTDGSSHTFALGEQAWNGNTYFRTWVRGVSTGGLVIGSSRYLHPKVLLSMLQANRV